MEETNIGNELKQCSIKKDSVREAMEKVKSQTSDILVFNLQWSDLVDNLKSAEERIEKRFKELESKEEELQNRSLALEERAKVVEAAEFEVSGVKMKADELKKAIEDKGDELGILETLVEECTVNQTLKTTQLDELMESLRKTQAEFDLKRETLAKMEADLERHRVEVIAEKEQLDKTQTCVRECDEEIERKKNYLTLVQDKTAECEKLLKTRSSELELKVEQLEIVKTDLETRNIELDEDIERKKNDLKAIYDEIAESGKPLELLRKRLDSQQKLLETRSSELAAKKKEFVKLSMDLDLRDHMVVSLNEDYDKTCHKIVSKAKELEEIETRIEERNEEYESINLLIKEHCEELASKEKEQTEKTEAIRKLSTELVCKEKTLERSEVFIQQLSEKLRSKENKLVTCTADLDSEKKKLRSVRYTLRECLKNLETKKRELESLESLITADKNKQVEGGEKKMQHLDDANKELKRQIHVKQEELLSIKKAIMECSGELESKKKHLNEVQSSITDLTAELKSKQCDLGSVKEKIQDSLKELESVTEQQVSIKRSLMEREKELDAREERIDKRDELLKSTKEKLDRCVKDYEQEAQKLPSSCQQRNRDQDLALIPVNNVVSLDASPEVQQPPNERQISLCSETNTEDTTSRSGQQGAEKKRGGYGDFCGKPDEFCISGRKMTIPKKPRHAYYQACNNSKKRGRDDESLSQSIGDDAVTCSDPEAHVPLSPYTTGKEDCVDFEDQRSCDKFKINQVWATYTDGQGMPRKYAQIKRIQTSPEFKLHVAPLEVHRRGRPSNRVTRPVCCGRFKVRTGIPEVLLPRSFSHQVRALRSDMDRFDVYPRKGEIWALYKKWNAAECGQSEQFRIVEVVETDEQRIRVVPLTVKGLNKVVFGRSRDSNAYFVDIPRTEASRFSHQIPAFRVREVTRYGDGECCWELDPKAVFDINL